MDSSQQQQQASVSSNFDHPSIVIDEHNSEIETVVDEHLPSAVMPSAVMPSAVMPSAVLPSAVMPSAVMPSASIIDAETLGVPPTMTSQPGKQFKTRGKTGGIYAKSVITRRIGLGIKNIGRTLKHNLEQTVASEIEGKCIVEGFIKPHSIKILTFSSGLVKNGRVIFEVVFECLSCCPVEGMLIDCIAKNITKAGIRAEIDSAISPVVIFVARDHNNLSDYFNSISEGDAIKIRVIGQRFELNDKYVSIIAEIVEQREEKSYHNKKARLIIPK